MLYTDLCWGLEKERGRLRGQLSGANSIRWEVSSSFPLANITRILAVKEPQPLLARAKRCPTSEMVLTGSGKDGCRVYSTTLMRCRSAGSPEPKIHQSYQSWS